MAATRGYDVLLTHTPLFALHPRWLNGPVGPPTLSSGVPSFLSLRILGGFSSERALGNWMVHPPGVEPGRPLKGPGISALEDYQFHHGCKVPLFRWWPTFLVHGGEKRIRTSDVTQWERVYSPSQNRRLCSLPRGTSQKWCGWPGLNRHALTGTSPSSWRGCHYTTSAECCFCAPSSGEMVRLAGIEPSRELPHWVLNPARATNYATAACQTREMAGDEGVEPPKLVSLMRVAPVGSRVRKLENADFGHLLGAVPISPELSNMVHPPGLEPGHPYGHKILNLAWLPFHHGCEVWDGRDEGIRTPARRFWRPSGTTYAHPYMVPRAGLEPARSFEHEVLNLAWLPFHHLGKGEGPRPAGAPPRGIYHSYGDALDPPRRGVMGIWFSKIQGAGMLKAPSGWVAGGGLCSWGLCDLGGSSG